MPFKEKWKVIPKYSRYEISNLGAIRNRTTKFIKAQKINKNNGYLTVNLYPNDSSKHDVRLVHRLVAETFLPNPQKLPCVNHKDEHKLNNYIDNLEWVTYEANNQYGTRGERIGNANRGKHYDPWAHFAKAVIAIDEEGNEISFRSITECAKSLGLHRSSISMVLHGKMKKTKGYKIRKAE